MKKLFPSILIGGALVIGAALQGHAAVTYDLSSDFSPSANPAGPWTLGAKTNLSSGIVPYGIKGTTSLNGVPIEYWQLIAAQEPTIYRNGTATIATFGTSLTIPPGTVWLYAGVTASPYAFGAVRFTVPAGGAGSYVIESAVAPTYDGPPQGDTDYHVVHNGGELFGQFLPTTARTGYTNSLQLADGDTIDFLVGRGADNNNYGSGLKLKARLVKNDPPPPSELVVNGSFEQGIDPGVGGVDIPGPNSTSITGWTVENASVDYVGSRWTAGDGSRCIDLSGTDAATLSQMISGLTPGQEYRLSFLMAANPEVPTYTARTRVTIASTSTELTFNRPGITTANLGWTEKVVNFTATESSHKLSFISLNPGWAGATLDKVAIAATTNTPPPPPPPPTGLVSNGSFELGINPGISADLPGPDSTSITGWTIENASVDYIGTRWVAGDGARCLDMSGTDAATISQMISGLTPGQSYRLSFLMAANPEVSTYVARLRTTIANVGSEFEFSQPGITTGNLGWTQKSVTFTASASSHKLSFISLNPGWAGAALDKVEIAALAPLVVNGSFERGIDPGISTDLPGPDSTSITGWTIENASVDYIGSRWVAGDGLRCLDLSGTDAATISQVISGLAPGQTYRLSFLMAANPEVGAITARLRAGISGANAEYSFLQSGFSTANLGWVLKTLDFTASASSHKLSFTSLNPGWAGAALDKISIVQTTNTPPPPPPPTGLVANGSFEYGIEPGISTDLPGPDSTSITGWTIENASVDYIGLRWIAGDGERCLDLSGTDAATISQTISGLTPGQTYKLSFLMAANPEVGQFTALLQATVGTRSRRFSFTQTGFTTANLGWSERAMYFRATSETQKLSFTSLNPGWAGAALDKITISVENNPPPFNTPPVAKALASPLFTVWPHQTNLMMIAVNGNSANAVFDGSFSSDEDGDPLTFWWTKDDEASPFAETRFTTNSLSAGIHHVTLVVDDGEDDGADTLEIEVITLNEALDEIHAAIIESDLLRKDKRPLFAMLDRVSDAFENWRLEVGIRQLRAFQQKVRAQVARHNPDLAARLQSASSQIIEAVEIYLDSHEAPPKDDGQHDRK